MAWRLSWLVGLLGVLCGACSSTGGSGGIGGMGAGGAGGDAGAGGAPPEAGFVVTADWLNKTLSVFDYDALVEGTDSEDALLRTIDLDVWNPGPLEIEITPDGSKAVVASSPGFFDGDGITNGLVGSPVVPPGGALLIVDLDSGDVVEVATSDVPMGIAISADGTTAYTANYGTIDEAGNTMSIVDIEARVVTDEVTFGGRPEQVVLSPSGDLGVINIAGTNGGIHVFETSDPEGTLSPLVAAGNDPSDVTFLGDDTRVAVANSFSFDVTLIDTSIPSAPVAIESFLIEGGVPYGLTYVPERDQILAPTGTGANLVTIDIDGDTLVPSEPEPLAGGAFPLTVAIDPSESFAFVAHIEDQTMSIVDLDSGETRGISWLEGPGPAYVAVRP